MIWRDILVQALHVLFGAQSYYSGAEEHFTHEKRGPGGSHFDLANNTGDKIRPASLTEVGKNGTYSVYLYGNESIRYIRNHDPDTPLFMYLAWNVVHAPCEAPQHYIDQNRRIASPQRRNFAGMISALDDSVPQVRPRTTPCPRHWHCNTNG